MLSTTQNKQLVPYSMKARHDGLNSVLDINNL